MGAPTRWAIQEVFDITYRDIVTKRPFLTVDDLKSCSLEAAEETVFAMGGKGNAYISGFSHSKRFTGTQSAATYYNDLLSLLNGTDVATGQVLVPYQEVLTVTSDATISTYTAQGTAAEEITALFLHNTDGSFGTELTQGASVGSDVYTYTSGTKTFAFNTSDLADGTEIIVFYDRQTDANAHEINNEVNRFARIVEIIMTTLVQDACTGAQYAATLIVPRAKLMGTYTLDLAADGDPAELQCNFDALKASCTDDRLYRLVVDDESMST